MASPLTHLQTRRLVLLPCSLEAAQAVLRRRTDIETLLGVQAPDDWPAQDLQELLPFYAQQLEADPSLLGWGVWLMIHAAERVIIGDLGFKGKPDHEGTIEIGYSVILAYRRQGCASEAVRALVDWAFAQQGVRRITAECAVDNVPSIRILEKLGMQHLGIDGCLPRWELESRQT